MSEWVLDAGEAEFQAEVVERSARVPVVVDFWAPWCGPCKALGPLLERLAEEYRGAFVLVKVNVDNAPTLASTLNISSIPMVLGFRDGQIVSEFVGALPETAVRDFLSKVLPSEADQLAAAGEALLAAGKIADAEDHFRRALALDARAPQALIGLARILVQRREHDEALALLERVLPGPQRLAADQLAVQIRVQLGGDGDEQALRERLAAAPDDLDARFALAQALARAAQYPEALSEYVEIVRRNRAFRDGAARKAMLDIFELLGANDPTTERFRSELAKVLFS